MGADRRGDPDRRRTRAVGLSLGTGVAGTLGYEEVTLFKNRTWFKVMLAIVAVVVLIGAGVGVWSHGYRVGRLASVDSVEGVSPHSRMPYLWGRVPTRRPLGYASPWLGGVRFLFRIGGLVILFLVIGAIFRAFTWRRACTPGGRDWHGHHHPHHPGHPPHWFEGKFGPKGEGEAQTNDSAAPESQV
jgi:succinate dehydrogenase hydrophobic anchor subunit